MALFNRILSALLALALLLGGLLAAAEIVLAALGRQPWLVPHPQWSAWLREQTWDTTIVRAVLAGLAVVGLLLLLAALRRGKPNTITLPASSDASGAGVTVSASRRGIEKTLAAAARRTSGVSSASANAGRRKVKVEAQTSTRSEGDLQQQVTAAVSQRLDELGLSDTLRPRIVLNRKESR